MEERPHTASFSNQGKCSELLDPSSNMSQNSESADVCRHEEAAEDLSPVPVKTSRLVLESSSVGTRAPCSLDPSPGHQGSCDIPSSVSPTVESSTSNGTPRDKVKLTNPQHVSAVPASSPPNFLSVPAKSTSPRVKSPACRGSLPSPACRSSVAIKTEPQDDIKEYVETTMNELLGWYGLPKMDKTDTPQLSLDYSTNQALVDRRVPETGSGNSVSKSRSREGRSEERGEVAKTAEANDTNNNSSSCGADDEGDEMDEDGEEFNDDLDDLRDSGSDVSGLVSPALTTCDEPGKERGAVIVCSWCHKKGTKLCTLGTQSGIKSFCSELCFTQCRRALFKKNKQLELPMTQICDWCKSLKQTVNFVDFHDGDVQLQFCSEKCLNQYKMNVFCTEARQHLQQIVAGDEDKSSGDPRVQPSQGEILITPDLWLSNNANPGVRVKEEVEERSEGGGRQGRGEEEEPGELRDKRSSLTETNMRTAHSDDSSCSVEDRMGLKTLPVLSQRHDVMSRVTSKPLEKLNSCDNRYRRDRIKKLLLDGKPAESGTSGVGRKEKVKHAPPQRAANPPPQRAANPPPQRAGNVPTILSPTDGTENTAPQTLLPNWATSQLLAMMPPHVGLASGNPLRYGASPLLYPRFLSPNRQGEGSKDTPSSSQVKSRHESRRELLRDRDRSGENGHTERKRESTERSAIPPSPATSHSSADTPGPAHTFPHHGLNPNILHDFPRHLPPTFLLGDVHQQLPVHPYFSDPALSNMFHLPLAYNHMHGLRSAFPVSPPSPLPSTSAHPAPRQPAPSQQVPLFPQTSPPVTVLVPYPVAVPIPIPIPIPLPISPEKLFAFFKEKSESAKATTASTVAGSSHQATMDQTTLSQTTLNQTTLSQTTLNQTTLNQTTLNQTTLNLDESSMDVKPSLPQEVPHRTASASLAMSPVVSPRQTSKCPSVGCLPVGPHPALLDSPEAGVVLHNGRDSADSIMTLRREIGRSQLKAASTSPCSSRLKLTYSPNLPFTLDLSKRSRRESLSSNNDDEAIDLSKMSTRSESPRCSVDSTEKVSSSRGKHLALSDGDTSSLPQNLKVPRIHIISDPADPPLSQPPVSLPPPPELSSYSSRRSRILDAPCVPKKSRSPSPERRYIRTVPRDMVEAARRRGLRARVRTK
ncbi:sine oculis-binding protein homolog A-like isoform X3 [Physella acuta]|uniref:sine oculis-binding protein homolog A-like isoform X3 n=1 Tax=Physella acuta TaxID=109671 RepID=UPI0027DEA3D8|nr:sine oculis-binding protein homolog A-like isoform X3 [Physella acuta]